MRWIFIDEQTEKAKFGNFYCLTFASIADGKLKIIREQLTKQIFGLVAKEDNVIPSIPPLHGSDLLPGHTDDEKLLAVRAITDVIIDHDIKIGRIGYFRKDYLGEQLEIPAIAYFSIIDLALRSCDDDLVFVNELDISRHAVIKTMSNDFQYHYYYLNDAVEKSLSIPVQRILGAYYCDKANHWMQVADVASYILWIYERRNNGHSLSKFQKCLVKEADKILSAVVYSDIVQLNNPTFVPKQGPNGYIPLRAAFKITPSDTEDLSVQSRRFWDKVQSVWKSRSAKVR